MSQELQHIPVLADEVLAILAPKPGETILDATLGLGGHAGLFLQATSPDGALIGFDADRENLSIAAKRLKQWGSRAQLHHRNFRELSSLELPPVDIVFADLGLSSPHIDDPSRGFTFRETGPLDLRFDRTSGIAAAELIVQSDEDDLARIFRNYGELYREAKRLAERMAGRAFVTTTDLKVLVEEAFGFRAKQILPRVFQALRIAVNDELGALEILLGEGVRLLRPGGRMGVISFHSLEDRMVKHVFRALCTPERDAITGKISKEAPFELLTRKHIEASLPELQENPRARSAKFRAVRRRL